MAKTYGIARALSLLSTRRRRPTGTRRPLRPGIAGAGPERLEGRELPASNASLATLLTHSAEYYANLVKTDYQTYAGRTPNAEEVSYYVNQLQAGRTDENLQATFTATPEFYRAAGGTDAAWVNAMYRQVLGRTAVPSEVSYYVNSLAGGNSRFNIGAVFAGTAAHEQQVIAADFVKYLGRPATAADLNAWTQVFLAGRSNETIVADIVGSTEFSVKHLQADANFVSAAYQTIQGRPAAPIELIYGVSYLNGSPLSNVPASAVYSVTVSGSVNGTPFTQTGNLGLAPSIPTGGVQNPQDVGITTTGDPYANGPAGSLDLASNLYLFGLVYNVSNLPPTRLGNVVVSPGAGTVVLTVDPNVINSNTLKNVFDLPASGGRTSSIYFVSQGTMSLQIGQGGRTVSGTIQVSGHLAGSTRLVSYTATLSGTLA